MGYIGSKHMNRRLRQRGIKYETVNFLWQWADREAPVGRGDVSLTLSKEALHELAAEGVPVVSREKLKRLAVVVSSDGVIKTCLIIRKSGRGRQRYRKGL